MAIKVVMLVHSDFLHDRRVRNQATALAATGYLVTIFGVQSASINSDAPEITGEVDGVSYHLLKLRHPRGKKRYLELMLSFYRRIVHLDIDLLHAHDLDTLWPAYRVAQKKGIPLIYDSHELYTESIHVAHRPLTKWVWRILEYSLIRQTDATITVCQGISKELKERYGLEEAPWVVRNFSNPVLVEQTTSDLPELRQFKQYHPHTLLYQGYLQQGRGIETAIQALSAAPDWGLVICGQGPYWDYLLGMAHDWGVEDQLLYLGQLEPTVLATVTASCDVGLCMIEPVVLSYYYALPNKLIEYVQAGLPVIASDLPEIRNIMEMFKIGWMANDVTGLISILEHFESLKNDKNLKEGLIKASQVLNWHNEQHRLLEVYARIT